MNTFNVAILAIFICASPALASGGGHGDGSKTTQTKGDNAHPHFVIFPQIISSVLDGYKVHGIMILGYGLDIEDEALRKKTWELLPRLQDSFNTEFNRYTGNTYKPGSVPDADYISKKMQATADRMLGKGKSVFLISNLMVRQK